MLITLFQPMFENPMMTMFHIEIRNESHMKIINESRMKIEKKKKVIEVKQLIMSYSNQEISMRLKGLLNESDQTISFCQKKLGFHIQMRR